MGVWVGALLANKKSSENNTCMNNTCMNNTCMETALDRYEAWLEKEVNRPCESVEKNFMRGYSAGMRAAYAKFTLMRKEASI